jgi:putative endonuclease
MRQGLFFVYILTNRSGTLYIGVTNNLAKRVEEHRMAPPSSFTGRYHIHRLVYYETMNSPADAIAREKQLKGWTRKRKIALINQANPTWADLAPEPDPSLRSG